MSRRYAQANFDGWAVLSAKHGLLLPSDIISPYDKHIQELSPSDRQSLVSRVGSRLPAIDPSQESKFTSLCLPDYNEVLELAGMRPKSVPFASLSKADGRSVLSSLTDPRATETTLDGVYEIVHRLIEKRGHISLGDAIASDMPSVGIYLFFDANEKRLRDPSQLRVVRVGTHGVASGSKASLRDRMRTHFGTTTGGGNHRSSIFRLHVGRSLISAGVARDVKSWGETELPKSNQMRRLEDDVEAKVSEYIRNLSVVMLEVPGSPSKDNDRAYLEQNLIALLSNNYAPLDPSSHQWLGRFSEKDEIRRSALWNVNHTSQGFDPGFPSMLDYYVSVTLGKAVRAKPIAPTDWIASVRRDKRQLNLFSSS